MGQQPCSGNSAEERSIHWFEPIFASAVFYKVSKHLVSSLNQFSAVTDVIVLALIDLTHRCVLNISWYAEKLTE